MRKIVLIFMMLTCFLLADTKIGYIDATAVLSQYDDVRQVQVELEKEQRRLQTVWDSKKTTLDSLMSAYETNSMLMSEQKQQEMNTMINSKIISGIIKSIKPRTIAIERVSIKRIGLKPLKLLNLSLIHI